VHARFAAFLDELLDGVPDEPATAASSYEYSSHMGELCRLLKRSAHAYTDALRVFAFKAHDDALHDAHVRAHPGFIDDDPPCPCSECQ